MSTLEQRLIEAARDDFPLPYRDRHAVARVCRPYLTPTPVETGAGQLLADVAPELADAVEQITGTRPRSQIQIQASLRRSLAASRQAARSGV